MFNFLENLPYFARSVQMQCSFFVSAAKLLHGIKFKCGARYWIQTLLVFLKDFLLNLTLCMLGNFSCFCYHLFCFFKINIKKSFRNTIRVSNSLDPEQDRHSVGMSVLIWDKTVCKGYQQTKKFPTGKEGYFEKNQTIKKHAKFPSMQQVKQSRLIIINDHWCFGIGLDSAVCMCGTLQYVWFV